MSGRGCGRFRGFGLEHEGDPDTVMKILDESYLGQQIKGRLVFFKNLLNNISMNLETIKAVLDPSNKDNNGVRVILQDADILVRMGVMEVDQHALRANGIPSFYSIEKEPPKPTFFDVISRVILGAVQTLGGVFLICSGAGIYIGATLLSEGLQDFFNVMSGKMMSWGEYWIQKGVSALMCAASAAYSAIKDIAKTAFASGFTSALIGSTKEVTKEAIKKTAQKVIAGTLLRTAGGILVSEALAAAKEKALEKIKEDVHRVVGNAFSDLQKDKDFIQAMVCLTAFEAGRAAIKMKDLQMLSGIFKKLDEEFKVNEAVKGFFSILQKCATIVHGVEHSWITAAVSAAAILTQIGYDESKISSCCRDYVKRLRALVMEEVGRLPSLQAMIEEKCGHAENVRKWLAKARQEKLLLGGEKPYGPGDWAYTESEVEMLKNVPKFVLVLGDSTPNDFFYRFVFNLIRHHALDVCRWHTQLANLFLQLNAQSLSSWNGGLQQVACHGVSLGTEALIQKCMTEHTFERLSNKQAGTLTEGEKNELSRADRTLKESRIKDLESADPKHPRIAELKGEIQESLVGDARRAIAADVQEMLRSPDPVKAMEEKIQALSGGEKDNHRIQAWQEALTHQRAAGLLGLDNEVERAEPLTPERALEMLGAPELTVMESIRQRAEAENLRNKSILDQVGDAYDGSVVQQCVRGAGQTIGDVTNSVLKAAYLLGSGLEDPLEMLEVSRVYDNTQGPLQRVGEAIHGGVRETLQRCGASEHQADVLATGALDVLTIAGVAKVGIVRGLKGTGTATVAVETGASSSVKSLASKFGPASKFSLPMTPAQIPVAPRLPNAAPTASLRVKDRIAALNQQGAGVESTRLSKDYPSSTPVGHKGKEIKVSPGYNTSTTIEGTTYTGHALDRMQQRGITPSVVQNTLHTGTASPGNTPGTLVIKDNANNISIITDSTKKRIITVRFGVEE